MVCEPQSKEGHRSHDMPRNSMGVVSHSTSCKLKEPERADKRIINSQLYVAFVMFQVSVVVCGFWPLYICKLLRQDEGVVTQCRPRTKVPCKLVLLPNASRSAHLYLCSLVMRG